MTGGGMAGEWRLFPSVTLSIIGSGSLRVESVLPPSTARMTVGNRRGEWRVTEAMEGVGVGRRVFWSFVLGSCDASASSSVDLRLNSPNTMSGTTGTRRECDVGRRLW